jgi:hypothetical protein
MTGSEDIHASRMRGREPFDLESLFRVLWPGSACPDPARTFLERGFWRPISLSPTSLIGASRGWVLNAGCETTSDLAWDENRLAAAYARMQRGIEQHAQRCAMVLPIDPQWLSEEVGREFMIGEIEGRQTVVRQMRRMSRDGKWKRATLDVLRAFAEGENGEARLDAYVRDVVRVRARQLYHRVKSVAPGGPPDEHAENAGETPSDQGGLQARRRRLMHQMALELAEACSRDDEESIKYCRAALEEMERSDAGGTEEDLDDWRENLEKSPEGRKAIRSSEQERETFLRRYRDLRRIHPENRAPFGARTGCASGENVAE